MIGEIIEQHSDTSDSQQIGSVDEALVILSLLAKEGDGGIFTAIGIKIIELLSQNQIHDLGLFIEAFITLREIEFNKHEDFIQSIRLLIETNAPDSEFLKEMDLYFDSIINRDSSEGLNIARYLTGYSVLIVEALKSKSEKENISITDILIREIRVLLQYNNYADVAMHVNALLAIRSNIYEN